MNKEQPIKGKEEILMKISRLDESQIKAREAIFPTEQVYAAMEEYKNQFIQSGEERWISVVDGLPVINEPLMGYNDENIREVLIENYEATVLAYEPGIGIIKAKINKHLKWAEVSSISSNGCINPTHWQPLPKKPNGEQKSNTGEEK